ncbi:MAG TPA: hypothetical protein VFG04_09100 [Planctomycetaceae bacterium]|nr:hypothetical protein [Planctomycetaceae bacterium]
MRYRRAISITTFVISLFGSLVWLMRQNTDNPLLILGWPVLFICWAIAVRWWLVAGALIALVASVITGPLHGDLGRMVFWMIGGAGAGFLCEFLHRPEAKPPDKRGQPTTSSAPGTTAENA